MDLYGDELLTTEEAAQILKTSVWNVKKMIYRGKLIASKMGWQWRIKKSEISTFMEIHNRPAK
jgi:excisionase family DNA binding protein